MPNIPLYVPEPLPGTPLATWFAPLAAGQLFVEHLPPNFFETSVERMPSEKGAQAIVLQNSFRSLDAKARAYIEKYAALGEQAGIPVVVFSLGDFTDGLDFGDRVFVLRFSLYRSSMGPRDIALPTTSEIPMPEWLTLQGKRTLPVVGFCGKAAFASVRAWAGYFIKESLLNFKALGAPMLRAKKIGIYWRRAMMRACLRSTLVESRFIVRSSFSGLRRTIELDPAAARREFLQNIADSDFVLAPKGDGNYSNRFLETLSLGRIPVLVDTDAVVPLEGVIEYSKIIVRVPMNDVRNTPRYIADFYNALTNNEWEATQKLARDTYNKYLRQDAYFRHFFTVELPKLSAVKTQART